MPEVVVSGGCLNIAAQGGASRQHQDHGEGVQQQAMPRTEAARRGYRRDMPRCASDPNDREWALVAPFMPPPNRIRRPRTVDLREVMNATPYIATTGCQWAMLQKDFPPCSTVQHSFHDWRDSGLLRTTRFALAMETREPEGREARPSAGVIDSQSVKATESGGVRGYDAGKRINGCKRHIVVDTIGLLFGPVVHAADIHDRDGVPASIPQILPVAAACLCRWRVFGAETPPRARQDRPMDDRDRPALRRRHGPWGPASAVGRGANPRMARQVPASRQGPGEIHRLRRSLDQRRPYKPHRPVASQGIAISDRARVGH